MTIWDDINRTAAGLHLGNIDIAKIVEVVEGVVAAAPAIERGVSSAAPFVLAIIELVQHGGNPTDAEWAALKARLDAGSAALQKAAKE